MIQGIGASAGIAIGKTFVLPNWEWDLPEQKIDVSDLAKEFERLYEGIRTSKHEIEQIKDELAEVVGTEERNIFDAHLAILNDPVFMNEIQGIIKRQYKAAEVAVKEAIDHFVTMFDLLDDEYMKERAIDIKDVGNRLLKHLLGAPEITLPADTQPFILVAKEISPSQLAHLNPQHVLGIVTVSGSTTSHSAIMARALGIPLVVGIDMDLEALVATGDRMVLDGNTGIVILNPSTEQVDAYSELQNRHAEHRDRLRSIAGLRAVTPDGKEIELAANISSLKELEVALRAGAMGVGLFRTEFLYMDRNRFPEEEEQFEVYKAVAERLNGSPLIIRTLDIGGDKQLDYFEVGNEENPFLGYRAIRISLDRKDLFKTQLRAILRASAFGSVKVMYPLISSVEEVRAAKAVLEEVKAELKREGKAFDGGIENGIMIELPAAVSIADFLAEEVDFFSIGTNDLVQFALAVDRMNERISHLYQPFHPAVLRMLRSTVEAAKSKGIHVGVCGELAGDPRALPLWLSLDVDELSMSSHAILPIKERLLCTTRRDSRELLNRLEACRTAQELIGELEAYKQTVDAGMASSSSARNDSGR
ncbi:phosphoenolpyruvate-protein phosphotransferase [Paenibacillus darwinianus]|uniref:Phosphoenolpyruvate-protein phosphotransferase n=1 Tax=Paenibacillus darwinianus TaxID=1380763 RepID=A0A9W5S182_9BACL|nr:phosphoenolpyruvate--protein phosphotransferase [Paenibacillus darwinianus]EXX88107.1 phosphoenolpyruvate-protein phosphotransferase [Paenibacillus darwinianus]EXX88293.1 phosphoenolpyruvate-protein phosphotransferase [Paenibacillus darwinianus]EXX89909.1 phosphoenolpyruvate-protein phosphotransferase [Paenibacillus darwinianus]